MQYLKRMLDIVKKDETTKKEFTSNVNISYDSLLNQYKPILDDIDVQAEKEASEVEVNANSDYEIIEIPNFDTANKYGAYTGVNGSG